MDRCDPEAVDGAAHPGERPASAFRRELAERTRRTGTAGGVLGFVVYLSWAGFDRAIEPAHAAQFLGVRVMVATVLAVGTLLLASGLARGSAAERTTLTFVVAIQCGIAWMIPRVDHALPAYLLGFTLTIYGCVLLIEWFWTYTVAVVGLSWLALAVADVTAPEPLSAIETVTCASYVATSSMISLVGQWLHYRTSCREFAARAEAECEREQNLELLRRLDHLSRHDPLTDLPNRRLFDDALTCELAGADRDGSSLALVLLDIDHFKQLNDTYGHQAGDRVLQVVGSTLAARVRAGDLPARYGGEEFAVVLPGMSADDVLAMVETLRRSLHEATHGADDRLGVTLSAGVAVYPQHARTGDDLVRAADLALYAAKDGGRDQTRLATAQRAPSVRSTP